MSRAIAIVLVFLVAISFGAGYYVGYRGKEIPNIKPITKYVPIQVPKTVVVERPVVEYVYKPVDRVRVDTVYVPVDMKEYVISDRYPLNISPKSVTFRYFDPERGGYQDDVYRVPNAPVRFTLTGGVGVDAIRLVQGDRIGQTTPDINIRADLVFRNKYGAFASFNTKLFEDDWQARLGVSYVLFSK